MEVTFVGTGDAFGAGGRRQSAILVRAGGGAVLLDCGATTGSGLRALGIARDEIDAIVVSHFHGDHFGGIPLLALAALYEDRRRRPLVVAGPPGVEARVHAVADAFTQELRDRPWSFPLEFVELSDAPGGTPGPEQEIGPLRVAAFPAHHQPASCPHGLIVRAENRRLVYTGDTGWFPAFPERVGGADLLVTECNFFDEPFEYHLNYFELSERLRGVDCGRVVLTHLGETMSRHRGRLAFDTADDGWTIQI